MLRGNDKQGLVVMRQTNGLRESVKMEGQKFYLCYG